jgi:hypothetical protein
VAGCHKPKKFCGGAAALFAALFLVKFFEVGWRRCGPGDAVVYGFGANSRTKRTKARPKKDRERQG